MNKVDYIKDALEQVSAIRSSGFKFSGLEHRAPTGVLRDRYVLRLSNDKSRTIELIFHPSINSPEYFLVNLKNNQTGEVFNLKNWLKKYKRLPEPSPFKLSSYSGAFEEKISEFMSFLDGVFGSSEINDMLNNWGWESIPFDWAGMK